MMPPQPLLELMGCSSVPMMPLVSARGAALLASGRIPGIAVPPAAVEAFARYEAPADQRRHGLETAGRLAEQIAGEAAGLYLILPFGRRTA